MKILITAHGNFGQGILDSYQMIAGENQDIHVIALEKTGIHEYRQALDQWMIAHQEEDILILSDLQGGTPFNESYRWFLEHPKNIRLLAGVNLGMVLEVGLQLPLALDLQSYATLAYQSGQCAIVLMEEDTTDEDDFEL